MKRGLKKAKRNLYYMAGAAAAKAVQILPMPVAQHIFAFIAVAFSFVVPTTLRRAEANLAVAFPELSPRERRRILRRMLANMGRTFAEYLHLPLMPPWKIRSLVRTDAGFGRIKADIASGRGVIGVSGHVGDWELLGAFSALNMKTTVVARKIYFEKFDAWVNAVRRKKNVNVVFQQASPRPLMRAIKDGHFIGILADQDIDSINGVFVDFFGKPAFTPTAPAALAAKTGAPLYFYCLVREGRGHFLYVDGPMTLRKTADAEADVKHNTELWSAALERLIRKYPDQWPWFHRRWKTRPPEEK
jgi:KDO2-lipid IV(A) lauroyltransferase